VTRTIGLTPRRPWLPAGETLRGRLFVPGQDPALGVDLLDRPGALDLRVRLGYAPGLIAAGPQVSTLALRLDVGGRPADLLFSAPPAARGTARRRRDRGADDCTLLASRTAYAVAGRPLVLAARVCGSESLELLCREDGHEHDHEHGHGNGWRSVADLRVSPFPVGEPPLLADPVAHPLPGLSVLERGRGRAV
jgi:hypothetical protein